MVKMNREIQNDEVNGTSIRQNAIPTRLAPSINFRVYVTVRPSARAREAIIGATSEVTTMASDGTTL